LAASPMDLSEIIQRLYAEKENLARAISALETLQHGPSNGAAALSASARGRKSMNSDERQEVSLRMKKYWAKRRVSTMKER
jgi:hypothetical protein